MKDKKVLAIIPARKGSKSVIDKNILPINGKPLLGYSIEHAIKSKYINRIVLSTDSEEYADIGRDYGAEVPFLRPEEYSQDSSTDLEVFQHVLSQLEDTESYIPDIVVHLRPTYPVRNIADIDKIVEILIEDTDLDAVRSISEHFETPFKMWFKDEKDILKPVVATDISEAHSLPRQSLPKAFLQNACIDAIRPHTILKKKSMVGQKVKGYVMDDNFDIDFFKDFSKAERYLKISEGGPHTFCFDCDGVIATLVEGNDYNKSTPMQATVNLINFLYEKGHEIIIFTARGSMTGIDWKEITRSQMEQWGVKYHKLMLGKPAANFYIDDRFIDLNELIEITR